MDAIKNLHTFIAMIIAIEVVLNFTLSKLYILFLKKKLVPSHLSWFDRLMITSLAFLPIGFAFLGTYYFLINLKSSWPDQYNTSGKSLLLIIFLTSLSPIFFVTFKDRKTIEKYFLSYRNSSSL